MKLIFLCVFAFQIYLTCGSNTFQSLKLDALDANVTSKFPPVFDYKRAGASADYFVPSHYDLHLKIKPDTVTREDDHPPLYPVVGVVEGKVRIFGVVQNAIPWKYITLYASQLKVNEGSVNVKNVKDGKEHKISAIYTSEDFKAPFIVIELEKGLKSGEQVEIFAEFEAPIFLESDNRGMDLTKHEDILGNIYTMIRKRPSARFLFPCLEKPSLRATYNLTVVHSKEYTSISNNRLLTSNPDPQHSSWVVNQFAKTQPISPFTLTLQLLSPEFEVLTSNFSKNIPLRLFYPKNVTGQFTDVTVAADMLTYFDTYFNEFLPVTKLDLVMLPQFQPSNGTGSIPEAEIEYGLSSYSRKEISKVNQLPTDYMYSVNVPGSHNSEYATSFKHPDLSDVLSMQFISFNSFNNIPPGYLPHALQRYLAYLGLNSGNSIGLSEPESSFEFSVIKDLRSALSYDAQDSDEIHSLETLSVEDPPREYRYLLQEKGGSILRMAEGFLTRDTLRKGIIAFMKEKQFHQITLENFFEYLQQSAEKDGRLPKSSKLNVANILHSFTDQKGYPIVKVAVVNSTHVSLSQERFGSGNESYYIHVSIFSQNSQDANTLVTKNVWLEKDGGSKLVEHDTSKWFMLNKNVTGYYRTLYDNHTLDLIRQQLENDSSVISVLNRAQLIDDYFAFAEKGYVDYTTALNLSKYFAEETEYPVWLPLIKNFNDIHLRFTAHPKFSLVESYLKPKIEGVFEQENSLKRLNKSGDYRLLKLHLMPWFCKMNNSGCQELANKLFSNWTTQASTFDKNVRNQLECAMVAVKGREAVAFLKAKYPKEDSELIPLVTCTQDPEIITEFLNEVFDKKNETGETDKRRGHFRIIHSGVFFSMTKLGRQVTLKRLADMDMTEDDELPLEYLQVCLNAMTLITSTDEHVKEVDQLVAAIDNKAKTNERWLHVKEKVGKILDLMRDRVGWMDTTGTKIVNWLSEANIAKT